jgi:hypothetical protein
MQRVFASLCKTGNMFTNMQEDRLAARMNVLWIQAADPYDQKLADEKIFSWKWCEVYESEYCNPELGFRV